MWTFAGLTRIEWTKLLAFLIGLVVFIEVARPILGPFIVAMILAYVFYPVVSWTTRRTRLPRAAVVGLIVLVLVGAAALGGYQLTRRAARQATLFQESLPRLEERMDAQLHAIGQPFGFDPPPVGTLINPSAGGAGDPFDLGGVLTPLSVVGRALVEFVLVIFSTAYLLLDGERLAHGFWRFVPQSLREPLRPIVNDIQSTLQRYISAQGLLVVLMSIMAYLFVVIPFHLRFGLLIAVGVGLLEVIPIAGPWIGIGGAGLLALVQHDPTTALGVIVVLTILRQLEDQLVIPFVVGQAVHLPPVITLIAVAVGGLRGGFLGLLLAIPVAAAIKVILDHAYPLEPPSEPEKTEVSRQKAEGRRQLAEGSRQ